MSPLERAIAAGAVVVVAGLFGLLLRRVLLPRLARLSQWTTWGGDDLLVESLRGFLPFWCVLAGLAVGLQLVVLPAELASTIEKSLLTVAILSASLWAANVAARVLELGIGPRTAGRTPLTGVTRYSVKLAVLSVGGLMVLSTLGISVTPILTTLGIGGLAVALGLQDTLSNLFAGMHITLARNLRVGDFIRLESGEEGFVEDIGWRSARVRTLPNNAVVIPNNRLAESVITNYFLPSKEVAVLVDVGVHYASDLDQVERVACEVGRNIMQTVAGGIPDFEPFIRYNRFGDSSIAFTMILRAREFGDNFLIKHEFIKALSRRFADEGIVIPYPIRAINTIQEMAPSAEARE
jgi:small-conductance mechanosensitive channel